MRGSSVFFFIICVIALFFAGNFYYHRVYNPCSTPLSYSIGFIDPRQNITRDKLAKLLVTAENIWEKPIGRDLFKPETSDDFFSKITGRSVVVNVRYDERQEKKNILSAGERSLDDEAKNIAQEKSSLELLQSQYTAQKDAYEKAVSAWNKSKRNSLETHNELVEKQMSLKQLEEIVIKKVAVYNQNVTAYNQKVNDFNIISHFEDEAGTTRGRRIIDLYLLESDTSDAYLIAHELGHAIGIDGHSTDENALMYYRLPKGISAVSDSDLALLAKACKW